MSTLARIRTSRNRPTSKKRQRELARLARRPKSPLVKPDR